MATIVIGIEHGQTRYESFIQVSVCFHYFSANQNISVSYAHATRELLLMALPYHSRYLLQLAENAHTKFIARLGESHERTLGCLNSYTRSSPRSKSLSYKLVVV